MQVLPVGTGRDHSTLWAGHHVTWRGSLASPLFANHTLIDTEQSEAGAWYALQPRWQQRAALHKAKASTKQSHNPPGAMRHDRQWFWLKHLCTHPLTLMMPRCLPWVTPACSLGKQALHSSVPCTATATGKHLDWPAASGHQRQPQDCPSRL